MLHFYLHAEMDAMCRKIAIFKKILNIRNFEHHFQKMFGRKSQARVTVKLDFRRPPAPIFTPRMCFFHYSLFQKSRSVNSFSSSSSMIQRKNLNVIRFLICFGIERIGLKSIGLIHGVSIIRNLFRTVSTKLGFIKSRDI